MKTKNIYIYLAGFLFLALCYSFYLNNKTYKQLKEINSLIQSFKTDSDLYFRDLNIYEARAYLSEQKNEEFDCYELYKNSMLTVKDYVMSNRDFFNSIEDLSEPKKEKNKKSFTEGLYPSK